MTIDNLKKKNFWETVITLLVCVRKPAPPVVASPLEWPEDNPPQTAVDAFLGQSDCTGLSKIYANITSRIFK